MVIQTILHVLHITLILTANVPLFTWNSFFSPLDLCSCAYFQRRGALHSFSNESPLSSLFLLWAPLWGHLQQFFLLSFLLWKKLKSSLVWGEKKKSMTILNFLFFKNKFILFIYFRLHWVLIAACRLSLVAASRGYSSLCARASHCSGFSCGAWALGTRASVVVVCRLSSCGSRTVERRLSSCGTWA